MRHEGLALVGPAPRLVHQRRLEPACAAGLFQEADRPAHRRGAFRSAKRNSPGFTQDLAIEEREQRLEIGRVKRRIATRQVVLADDFAFELRQIVRRLSVKIRRKERSE